MRYDFIVAVKIGRISLFFQIFRKICAECISRERMPFEPAAFFNVTLIGGLTKPNKLFIFNLKDHVYLLELFRS